MMLNIVLIIIQLFINISIPINGHILTIFNELEEYAAEVLEEKDFKWRGLLDITRKRDQTNYCEKLRTARIFKIADENTASMKINYTPKDFFLPRLSVIVERNHQDRNIGHKKIIVGNRIYKKTSFDCLAPDDETYKWGVIHDDSLNGGFLLHNTPKEMTTRGFSAAVDDEALFLGTSSENLELYFTRSSIIRQEESLCYLNRNIRFRICSLVADTLYEILNINNRSTVWTKSPTGDQFLYKDPNMNFYYLPNNADELCPRVTVNTKNNFADTPKSLNLLKCHTSIKEFDLKFYISRNRRPLRSSQVFIIMKEDEQFIVKYDMFIPLLTKIKKLEEIWTKLEGKKSSK